MAWPRIWALADLVTASARPEAPTATEAGFAFVEGRRNFSSIPESAVSTVAKLTEYFTSGTDDCAIYYLEVKTKPVTDMRLFGTANTARCVRGAASQGPGRGTSTAAPEPVKQPRTKQTAPQGNGSRWSQSRPTPRDPSPETPRFATLQTARRGGSFAARGRIPAPSGYDDAPPPYSEFPYQDYSSDENNGSDDVDEVSLAPLGLLNGDYEVESRDVSKQWDFDRDEFQLTLTIAGNRLWGRFNLGVYEGVLLIEERPMRSSHDRVWFKWRGREDQGPVIYGDRNEGWMEFLGDGLIEGWLDHQSLSFQARRLPGQGTRSSIDARTLQDEWNGYSYRLYEEENRARWR
ncbi:hypothetical protein H9Q74_005722 [Fusarium xylarioides]|nr:hypothetical protein H9Q71_005370 [Fusarium xylarioides]KAG5824165.1 hypothetical protein H9Q74_005722 [Fusarium xylarioides]